MIPWRLAFASATGTSHIKVNKQCEDSCTAEVLGGEDNEVLVMCVADGAGSAARSAEGSSIVCTDFVALCRSMLESGATVSGVTEHTVREGWICSLRKTLVDKACEESAELRDFATTFLGAVIADECCIFVQIGDGAILASETHAPEDYSVVCWPQHGEYANTTNFLTDIDAAAAAVVTILQRSLGRVVLFSDGMERLLLDFANHCAAPRPINQLIRPLLDESSKNLNASLRSLLESPNVNARTDDDKSLVLAARC